MSQQQGIYWLLTIPQHCFTPYLPNGVQYIRGQLEQGGNTGYLHWQILVALQNRRNWERSKRYLATPCMPNYPNQMPPTTTSGKKKRMLRALDSNWENVDLNGTKVKIGTPLETKLNAEGWMISRVTCTLDITGPSKQLPWIILHQLNKNEKYTCSMDQLEPEKVGEHGKKPVFKHT